MDWVRACWPDPLDRIAIDGKTVRRSHDRAKGRAARRIWSLAVAANGHLVLGQEAVDDTTNETTAIPLLLEKLAAGRSLEGAVAAIDAIACNPQIARSIRDAGADYLLAVKGNQPSLQADNRGRLRSRRQGPGRNRRRSRQGPRPHRDPLRLGVAADRSARRRPALSRRSPLRRRARHRQGRSADRVEGSLPVRRSLLHLIQRSFRGRAQNIRGHWGIETTLHWTLDVTVQGDLSRLRKGHGAQNMALMRKFAFNKLRAAPPFSDPPNLPVKPCRRPTKPPRPKSLKLRRKIASWDVNRLAEILMIQPG